MEPIKISQIDKRIKTSNQNSQNNNNSNKNLGIQSLPVEILVEILSYLNSYDLHALEEVSTFFEQLVRQPPVWKTYEVGFFF